MRPAEELSSLGSRNQRMLVKELMDSDTHSRSITRNHEIDPTSGLQPRFIAVWQVLQSDGPTREFRSESFDNKKDADEDCAKVVYRALQEEDD